MFQSLHITKVLITHLDSMDHFFSGVLILKQNNHNLCLSIQQIYCLLFYNFFNDYFLNQRFTIFNNLMFHSFDDESFYTFLEDSIQIWTSERKNENIGENIYMFIKLENCVTCTLAQPQQHRYCLYFLTVIQTQSKKFSALNIALNYL